MWCEFVGEEFFSSPNFQFVGNEFFPVSEKVYFTFVFGRYAHWIQNLNWQFSFILRRCCFTVFLLALFPTENLSSALFCITLSNVCVFVCVCIYFVFLKNFLYKTSFDQWDSDVPWCSFSCYLYLSLFMFLGLCGAIKV